MDEKTTSNSRILGSTHLNFFFGAGVNGNAIKKIKDLKKTNKLLNSCGKKRQEILSMTYIN